MSTHLHIRCCCTTRTTEDFDPNHTMATAPVETCTHTYHSPTLKVVPLPVAASDLPTLLWAVTVTVYCVP